MHEFTPWTALIGGTLIGLSASMMLLVLGRVTGVSGLIGGLVQPQSGELGWRVAFLAGLVLAGAVGRAVAPEMLTPTTRSPLVFIAAGLLVGIGTRLGGGCTSGHGVCGVSRGSPRSFAAVVVFISAGVVTVAVIRMLTGAP